MRTAFRSFVLLVLTSACSDAQPVNVTIVYDGGTPEPVNITIVNDAGTSGTEVKFIEPISYKIGLTGPDVPYTGVIALDAGCSAYMQVPPDASYLLVTVNPQTDSIYPRVDQLSPTGTQTTYDPRPAGWMPIWPGVDTIELVNPTATGVYLPFAVLFANQYPE